MPILADPYPDSGFVTTLKIASPPLKVLTFQSKNEKKKITSSKYGTSVPYVLKHTKIFLKMWIWLSVNF